MTLSSPPIKFPFNPDGTLTPAWEEWILGVYRSAKKYQGTGLTAGRPTNSLEVGDWYWDQTLSKPIWWNGSVWKDATGTTV